MTPSPEPYILVYANDAAISESESVVSSLQGHRNFPTGAVPKLTATVGASSFLWNWRRREAPRGSFCLCRTMSSWAEYQYKEDRVVGGEEALQDSSDSAP